MDIKSNINKTLKRNINNILSSIIVKDIMIPRSEVVLINFYSNIYDIINTIINYGYSRYPVYDNHIDNIIGIIYAKDIIKYFNTNFSEFNLNNILRKPLFVPENKKANELFVEFKKERMHQAIVVDEYGIFLGIICLEDIIEILVGDIEDEYDIKEELEIVESSPNNYTIKSNLNINEFNKIFGTKIFSNNFETIGGFIIDMLGYVPKKGEIIEYNNLIFEISEVSGSKIKYITVKKRV